MTSKQQPASRIETYFPILAAIWRNEKDDGKAWYSATIERKYKDKDGKWQSATGYSADDLLLVQKVAGLAHSEIYKLMQADRAAQREPGEEG